jgi:hypothetical protein
MWTLFAAFAIARSEQKIEHNFTSPLALPFPSFLCPRKMQKIKN